MKVLCSSLLFLLLAGAAAGANTPGEALDTYYRLSQGEDLAAYYEIIDTDSMGPAELQARRDVTSILWQRFDTLDYRLENVAIEQHGDVALAAYRLKAKIAGPDDSGRRAVLETTEKRMSLLVDRGGAWKVALVSDVASFKAGLRNIFLRRQVAQVLPAVRRQISPTARTGGAPPPTAADTVVLAAAGKNRSASAQVTAAGASRSFSGGRLWIEAEEETARHLASKASGEHDSYPHFGRAYWYLASGGDWIEYHFQVPAGDVYYIWLRDFDDAKHDPVTRSVRVAVDGITLATVCAHTRDGGALWDWTPAASRRLAPGPHILRITKDETTSAAALIDAVFITTDKDARPPESAPTGAVQAKTPSSFGSAAAVPLAAAGTSGSYRLAGQWGGKGKADGQFEKPIDVTVDARGYIYVSDFSDRIQKFDPDGNFVAVLKAAAGAGKKGDFNRPFGLAVDGDNNLYVADYSHGRIHKFSPEFKFIRQWKLTKSPYGIAADGKGYLLVAELYGDRVRKFSADGKLLGTWGSSGKGAGQFIQPTDVAVDADGNVFVLDHKNSRVQKFDARGRFLTQWGSDGYKPGQFSQAYYLAVDRQGCVYVSDAGNRRIQKFDGSGKFLCQFGKKGSGEAKLGRPGGIAVDADGNIYVVDRQNHRVKKYAPQNGYQP